MDRRAARRIVSVGALLALTVWMGGLPAAVADEPVPETPVAASPAVPSVGDEPVTDVTPNPEPSPSPSVEPSVPIEEPTPTTQPTPTPEPSTPGTGNDEPQQPGPVSDPTPTPSDEPPVANGDDAPQPRPTPSAPPHSTVITGGHAADSTSAEAPITIGDFDCGSLTTTVTLDNSESPAISYTISVTRWTAEGGIPPAWERVVPLDAGAVADVTVPLVPDAWSSVDVFGPDYAPFVSKGGSCGTFAYDPQAAIGPFDCAASSIPVMLDNSRSTIAVSFEVVHRAVASTGATRAEYSVIDVPGGKVRNTGVAQWANATNTVTVTAMGPEWRELASGEATCGYSPTASVGSLDCGSLSGDVTLDNTSVPVPTVFTVQVGDGVITRHEEAVDVAPGVTTSISVPLANDTKNLVQVLGPGEWVLAAERAACGSVVEDPTASIGEFDCGALTVAVTLDNTRSTVGAEYTVFTAMVYLDHLNEGTTYVVAAGEQRVIQHPIYDSTMTVVQVNAGRSEEEKVLARAQGPLCGLVTVSDVDCRTMSITVSLENVDPYNGWTLTYVVSSTKYPKSPTAYVREVSVPADTTKVLRIPVAALEGGDVRVQIPAEWRPESYVHPVVISCPSGSGGSGAGSSAGAGTRSLAATGAEELQQLVLGGLLMLTLGGVLLRVGQERRV